MFLKYFKAAVYAPVTKSYMAASFFAIYFLGAVNLFNGIAYTFNGWALVIALLCTFVFCAGIGMNACIDRSPNLVSLIPISRNKSVLYRFFSVLLMYVIIVTAVCLFLLLFSIIIMLFSQIPGCNGEVEPDVSETVEETLYPIGLYGGIFSAAYFVIMYSSAMIAGLFRRRKRRNIFLVCLCAAVLIAFMLMGIPYRASGMSEIGLFRVSPYVNACYEAMKLPWLCITLWCIVAAATLGTAIYMGIKRYKSNY